VSLVNKAFVYGLADPRTGEVRYVGCTTNSLSSRLVTHCHGEDIFFGNPQKGRWVLGLIKEGLSPDIFLLEEVDVDKRDESELFWIKSMKFMGCDLLNKYPVTLFGSARKTAIKPEKKGIARDFVYLYTAWRKHNMLRLRRGKTFTPWEEWELHHVHASEKNIALVNKPIDFLFN
jgi:hypothetical protein